MFFSLVCVEVQSQRFGVVSHAFFLVWPVFAAISSLAGLTEHLSPRYPGNLPVSQRF